jgi:hypothetical protein
MYELPDIESRIFDVTSQHWAGQPATTSTGVSITATPLQEVDVEYLGEHTCTTVAYTNGSSDTWRYSDVFDWKLQNPQGAATGATFTARDGDLGSGELAPGGTVSGEVCFDGAPQPGRNLLVMEQTIALQPERLVWVDDV